MQQQTRLLQDNTHTKDTRRQLKGIRTMLYLHSTHTLHASLSRVAKSLKRRKAAFLGHVRTRVLPQTELLQPRPGPKSKIDRHIATPSVPAIQSIPLFRQRQRAALYGVRPSTAVPLPPNIHKKTSNNNRPSQAKCELLRLQIFVNRTQTP